MKRVPSRERGAVQALDLLLCFLLAGGIPAISFFAVKSWGLEKQEQEITEYREKKVDPQPDMEEVNTRIGYIRGLYNNALEFVNQARQTSGQEIKWARTALAKVRAEITSLRHLIHSTRAGSSFSLGLQEMTETEQRVDEGMRTLDRIDHLGVYR